MSQTQQNPEASAPARAGWLQWGVLGLGAVVFVLLLFADRTSLTAGTANRDNADQQPAQAATAQAAGLLPLPEGTDGQALSQLAAQLEKATDDQARISVLDRMVAASVNASRPDLAARFQRQLATLSGTPEASAKAARLYNAAMQSPVISSDSSRAQAFGLEAVEAFEAYLAKAPNDAEAQIDLALLHIQSGDPTRMMSKGMFALRDLAAKHPDNLRASLALGRFSLQTGQNDKAVERFRTAVQYHPKDAEAHFLLAQALAATGKTADARQQLSVALTCNPVAELKAAILEAQAKLN